MKFQITQRIRLNQNTIYCIGIIVLIWGLVREPILILLTMKKKFIKDGKTIVM